MPNNNFHYRMIKAQRAVSISSGRSPELRDETRGFALKGLKVMLL